MGVREGQARRWDRWLTMPPAQLTLGVSGDTAASTPTRQQRGTPPLPWKCCQSSLGEVRPSPPPRDKTPPPQSAGATWRAEAGTPNPPSRGSTLEAQRGARTATPPSKEKAPTMCQQRPGGKPGFYSHQAVARQQPQLPLSRRNQLKQRV